MKTASAAKKMSLYSLIVAAALGGCASIQSSESGQLGSLDTYTKCAVADVATTTIGLATHTMMEGNLLSRALFIEAFGAVGGYVVPVIGLSIAGYYLLRYINKPAVTASVSVATCAIALNNLSLIL